MRSTSLPPFLRGWCGVGLLAGLLAGTIGVRAADAGPDAMPLATAKKLFDGGQYAEARAAFEKIAAAEPQNAEVVFYLGWTTFRLNQPEESVKLLEKATALDATKSLYFFVLGDAYGICTQRASIFGKPGWAKKCLAAYDKAIVLDPDNVDARAARLSYYWHAPAIVGGGMDKAHAEAEEIRKRDPLRGAQALADLYVADKKYADAFAVVDNFIAKNPGSRPAQYHLGRLAAITGQQLDRGAAALEAYLQYSPQGREPGIAAAHWRLGMIYAQKGDPTAARAEYEAALKLNPGFAAAQESLKQLH
jgi:tetratricopeptide (TPR) repeat protein